jgi:hypothetical protein
MDMERNLAERAPIVHNSFRAGFSSDSKEHAHANRS